MNALYLSQESWWTLKVSTVSLSLSAIVWWGALRNHLDRGIYPVDVRHFEKTNAPYAMQLDREVRENLRFEEFALKILRDFSSRKIVWLDELLKRRLNFILRNFLIRIPWKINLAQDSWGPQVEGHCGAKTARYRVWEEFQCDFCVGTSSL